MRHWAAAPEATSFEAATVARRGRRIGGIGGGGSGNGNGNGGNGDGGGGGKLWALQAEKAVASAWRVPGRCGPGQMCWKPQFLKQRRSCGGGGLSGIFGLRCTIFAVGHHEGMAVTWQLAMEAGRRPGTIRYF